MEFQHTYFCKTLNAGLLPVTQCFYTTVLLLLLKQTIWVPFPPLSSSTSLALEVQRCQKCFILIWKSPFLSWGFLGVDQLLLIYKPSTENGRRNCCLKPFEFCHLLFNSIGNEWVANPLMETDPPIAYMGCYWNSLRGTRVLPGEELQYGTLYYLWVFMFMWVHLEVWNVKPHLHLNPAMRFKHTHSQTFVHANIRTVFKLLRTNI